jgi:hypothetical protein
MLSKKKVDANFNYNLGRIVEEGAPSSIRSYSAFFWENWYSANSRASIEAYLLYNGKKKKRLFFKW